MSRQLEQKLQEQYAIYLWNKGVLFCASSGGMHTQNKLAAMRMKRAGYKAGFPDVFIYQAHGKYHGMAIELKCGSYASKQQKQWQIDLTIQGYYAIIVPGKLDFFEARKFLEEETEKYLTGEV